MTTANSISTKPLIIERTISAPVAKVWKAWSEPSVFRMWWGPEGYSCPAVTIDFKVGGKCHAAMRGPDGKDIWSIGTYKEIVDQKRIVTTDHFADAEGNIVPPGHYGMEGTWGDAVISIYFEDAGDKTKMSIQHDGLPEAMVEDCRQGWNSSLDKMEKIFTSKMKRISFNTSINAPADKVWNALWDDASYREWTKAFSPTSHMKADWKKGGKVLFLDGDNNGMNSVIDELEENKHISFRHLGEVRNGVEDTVYGDVFGESHEIYTLKEANGKTELTADIDASSEFADYFATMFPQALAKVKEIAER
jgi:uncharacterized protein YndB with AHSA1/START domain